MPSISGSPRYKLKCLMQPIRKSLHLMSGMNFVRLTVLPSVTLVSVVCKVNSSGVVVVISKVTALSTVSSGRVTNTFGVFTKIVISIISSTRLRD